MEQKILDHYLQTSTFTDLGPYTKIVNTLPDNISELGNLITHSVIHRVTLRNGNTGANADKKYGDMEKFPWWRLRADDDVLLTAISMINELYRLDKRGLVSDRAVENKIVVTCRYVAVLMAALLKAKGIPARTRSGFCTYCINGINTDHWVNEYWNSKEGKWVMIDADGFFEEGFDQYNMPEGKFALAAPTWLGIRNNSLDPKQYVYADGKGTHGIAATIRTLMFDFHSLMNNEISFLFLPKFMSNNEKIEQITESMLIELDELATLMLKPEDNFDKLQSIWNNEKKYRLLNAPLIGDGDHVKWK